MNKSVDNKMRQAKAKRDNNTGYSGMWIITVKRATVFDSWKWQNRTVSLLFWLFQHRRILCGAWCCLFPTKWMVVLCFILTNVCKSNGTTNKHLTLLNPWCECVCASVRVCVCECVKYYERYKSNSTIAHWHLVRRKFTLCVYFSVY